MNSKNIIRNRLPLTVIRLFHLLFVLTLFAAASGTFAAREARGATFTVTNTGDSGCLGLPCSGQLRKAIVDANNNAGADTIVFNIPGTGVQTIVLAGNLPDLETGVTIDGTSQPGYAGVPLIEINATNADQGLRILNAGASSSTSTYIIKGLVINRAINSGLLIDFEPFSGPPPNVSISGCYIGTNSSGTTDLGNGGSGILINSLGVR